MQNRHGKSPVEAKNSLLSSPDINILDLKNFELSIEALVDLSVKALENESYIILRNFSPSFLDCNDPGASLLDFVRRIGDPCAHDDAGSLVWNIRKSLDTSSDVVTYSEHCHEAQLHTDSQYRSNPEDMFALLCLTEARCGGGQSLLLTFSDLMSELLKLPNADEVIYQLESTPFPFIVPTTFNQGESNDPQFIFAPIFVEDTIRFRIDTLEKALPYFAGTISNSALDAYYQLKQIILNTSRIKRFYLEPQDLLLVNNKNALHGRTAFSDSNRHLLRVRMDWPEHNV